MSDLDTLISEARTRWMVGTTGGAMSGHALVDGAEPVEADLRLLAIAGQDILINSRAAPPKLQDFPDLALPPLPFLSGDMRVYAQRAVTHIAEKQPEILSVFLSFLEDRGAMVHPLDWMPKAETEGLPPAHRTYQPGLPDEETLTAETWNDYPRAERIRNLKNLRSRDPDAARTLISELLQSQRADEREAILNVIAANPSADDVPLLESRSSDASKKVKERAAWILAEMGLGELAAENAAEAAELFDRTKAGLLRRSSVIRQKAKLNNAQKQNRLSALHRTNISALAAAMGLEPAQFISEIDPGSLSLDVRKRLIDGTRGLSPDLVVQLYDRLRTAMSPIDLFELLTERLDESVAEKKLIEEVCTLEASAPLAAIKRYGRRVPDLVTDAILKSSYFQKILFSKIKEIENEARIQGRYLQEHRVDLALHTLPLILSSSQAQVFHDQLTSAGLHEADPRLYALKINIHLKEKST